uniref:Putative chromatin remodeling protein n=1 Tax=Anopheles darlingi TaxID=43151 RepID=A0A2M4DAD1_ANODA
MAGLAQQTASQPIAPPSLQAALGAAVLAASASMPSSSSCLTPDQRPPVLKLKLSLGKKSRTSSTPSAKGSLKGANKRRTLTPKTPKSAPPLSGGFDSMVPAAPLTAPIAAPSALSSAPGYTLPIVPEQHPKVPPIGSFPSVQTEYFRPNQIRVPAGWRPPREGESVYCYCRCPYDEVSEMIACDDENCRIEWFHFECVGIIMPPKGKWYCPECTPKHPPQTDTADEPVFNSAPLQRQHPSMAFNANGPAGLAGVPAQPPTTSALSGLWGSSQP